MKSNKMSMFYDLYGIKLNVYKYEITRMYLFLAKFDRLRAYLIKFDIGKRSEL